MQTLKKLKRKNHGVQLFLGVLATLLFTTSSIYAAPNAGPCNLLLRKKKYISAGKCFQNLADQMKVGMKLNIFDKKVKGLYLIKSMGAYRKASDLEKKPGAQYLLKEQATKPLQQYLKEQLCTRKSKCKKYQKRLKRLTQEIQYAYLSLNNSRKEKISVALEGYAYKKVFPAVPKEPIRLRPGKYKLELYREGYNKQAIPLTFMPGKQIIFTVPPWSKPQKREVRKPPPPRRTVPKKTKSGSLVPWIVGGTGAALLIGGVVMLGLSQSDFAAYEEAYKNKTPKTKATEISVFYDAGYTKVVVGSILTGLGVIGVGAGVALLILGRNKKGKTASNTDKLPLNHPARAARTQVILFQSSNHP